MSRMFYLIVPIAIISWLGFRLAFDADRTDAGPSGLPDQQEAPPSPSHDKHEVTRVDATIGEQRATEPSGSSPQVSNLKPSPDPYNLEDVPVGYPFDPESALPSPPVSLRNVNGSEEFRLLFHAKPSDANPTASPISSERAAQVWADLEIERAQLQEAEEKYLAAYREWRNSIGPDSFFAGPFKSKDIAESFWSALFPNRKSGFPRLVATVERSGEFYVGVCDAGEALVIYKLYADYIFVGQLVMAKLSQQFRFN